MPRIRVDVDALSHIASLLDSSAEPASPSHLATTGRPLVDAAILRNDDAWGRVPSPLDATELAARVRACRGDVLSLEHALVEAIRSVGAGDWI